jgi:glycosyltransferase involved in cell wall biosynthesis
VRERTAVIPNGVDGRRFHPGDQAAARQRIGVAADRRVVFFPNTPTEPNKRLWLAEKAVDLVRREIGDVQLVVPANQHIPHDRMPDWYRAADLVLLTSLREGSPNVVKEAIACGVPVVTTDVGDVREWMEPAIGEIVDGSEAAIASAVKRALLDRPAGNPARVMSRISSEAVARRLIELYRTAVARRAPSPSAEVARTT